MAYDSNKKPSGLTKLETVENDDTVILGDTSDLVEVVKDSTLEDFRKSVVKYSGTAPSPAVDGELWIDTSEQLKLPVGSDDVRTIIALTQAEYDALGSYDSQTLYYITG